MTFQRVATSLILCFPQFKSDLSKLYDGRGVIESNYYDLDHNEIMISISVEH